MFADGCTFLVPYGLVFSVAYIYESSIAIAHLFYVALHNINLILFFVFVFNQDKLKTKNYAIALGLTFAAFYWNNIYLEFPSDTWEYFKFIFDYNDRTFIYSEEVKMRFTYFFSWSLLKYLPLEMRYTGLRFIGAFWSTLLCLQTFFLAKSLRNNSKDSILITGTSVLFLGFANLNYFRYLSLSSTLINFAFYYRCLIIMIEAVKTKFTLKHLLGLGLAVIGIASSHSQGFLLLTLSLFGFGFYKWYSSKPRTQPNLKIYILFLILSHLILITGWLNMMLRQYGARLSSFDALVLQKALSFSDIYSSSIGVPGFIAASFALILFFSYPLASTLSLVPFVFTIFPPTLKAIRFIVPYSIVSHRLMYVFPAGYFLYIALKHILAKLNLKSEPLRLGLIILLLVALSWPASAPWQGRAQNLIVQTTPEQDLRVLEPLAIWMQSNRNTQVNTCEYLTDKITDFYLAAQFGAHNETFRTAEFSNTNLIKSSQDIENLLSSGKFCGILVAQHDLITDPAPSKTNESLHHWSDTSYSMKFFSPKSFQNYASEFAQKNGWLKQDVPPFYLLYEEPGSKTGSH